MSHLELSQEKYNNILTPSNKVHCHNASYYGRILNCYHLQIIFKDLCEVVLQLRPSEVLQDFLPVWWVLIFNNQQ